MQKELTIIIVTYNSKEVIDKCLSGIYSPNFNITVVDNASSDGTAEFVAKKYPNVKIIRSSMNLGFGMGCNKGLREVETEYSMLLNPDVITTEATILEFLEKCKIYVKPAIFAPRTRSDKEYDQNEEYQIYDWVSGAVMLFETKMLGEIGYFDDNIFLFSEEMDLCKRARDAGYDIVMYNSIFMEHLVGKSSIPSPEMEYMKYWHMGWSRQYYSDKHDNIVEFFLITLRNLIKYSLKLLLNKISGNKTKFIKYKGLLIGSSSYIIGVKAFDINGNPRGI